MSDANSEKKEVVTRFAPSPTGRLHLGGARTALFCMALAKAQGGRFLLRIEDTDRERSNQAAVKRMIQNLNELGITWDEGPRLPREKGQPIYEDDPRDVGPFLQSKRHAAGIYEKVVEDLLDKDLAYPAFETQEELDEMRDAAKKAGRDFRYRRATDFDREEALARRDAGEAHVIRFRMPQQAWRVEDKILGSVDFAGELYDDFVLVRRGDGWPTYHLACVVDDALMGVTHVLRGQEHLNNTPRHIALQQALGYDTPVYAHLPVILNADGSKMSKRYSERLGPFWDRRPGSKEQFARREKDGLVELPPEGTGVVIDYLRSDTGGVSVDEFFYAGYLPEVIVNYLALLGWSPGEKGEDGKDLERFDLDYLCAHFSLERVGRANARFDWKKLRAFNQETLSTMNFENLCKEFNHMIGWYPKKLIPLSTKPEWFFEAFQPRCSTMIDFIRNNGPAGFFYSGDDDYAFDDKAVKKWLRGKERQGCDLLPRLRDLLAQFSVADFTPEAIEQAVADFCEAQDVRMGAAAQALRVAVTGTAASPPLGLTLALLGPGSVLARIDYCLKECCDNPSSQ